MQLTREINRLVFGILICFGIVTMAAAYWAVIGPDTILQREDNPRIVEAVSAIRRGAIVDRAGVTLAESTLTETGQVVRQYLYPAMNSALGYYSLRYGTDGAENAFDATLTRSASTDTSVSLSDRLLHLPQEGADI